MNKKLKSIYEERAKIYNCPPSTFEVEGITMLEVESLRNKNYFTLALFSNHLFIRIDPEMKVPFDKNDISSRNPSEFINLVKEHYFTTERSLAKTFCYYYYLKDEVLVSQSNLEINRITDYNTENFEVFLSNLSEEELELADVELENLDPVIFGGFLNENMVGYVSHRYPNGYVDLGDIGIVIDEEYRGRGYGEAMLSHEVNWCIRNGVVPMYVVLDDNKSSSRLVQKLGFEKICEIYRLK